MSEAESQHLLPFELVAVETTTTLDLTHVINNLDSYTPNDLIRSERFTWDDFIFEIRCYPKGVDYDSDSDPKSIDLFINVISSKGNDSRKIHASIKVADGDSTDIIEPLSSYADGSAYGWRALVTHHELEQCPMAQLNFKLYQDPLFVSKEEMNTFLEQNEKMHILSEQHGDVTLMIKLSPQNDTNNLYFPPKKKRRLNEEYKCGICQKPFATNKALKSHQSHKKDTAHKEYKNKNKNSNDNVQMNGGLDIDCNEIKMSSVILRSASKVFDRMLDHDMMEKQQKKIEIQAQRIDDVKDLTYFMSTNKLRNDSNVMNMIVLAHYYEMDRLFWECVYRLIKNVNVENFAKTINIFDKYQIVKGYDALVEFAKNNKDELQDADDFDTISHAFKCGILGA